jgi:hypothetical protein
MGKHRVRTSRGSGKNKQKKHTRTVWAGVEREVRRKELDQAEKTKNESQTEKTAQEVGSGTEHKPQHGDSATTASSSANASA